MAISSAMVILFPIKASTMFRHTLLIGTALVIAAGTAQAQPRKPSREDLLDALTTRIQICAEISDSSSRLTCYDKMQTQVVDPQAGAPAPTPLRPGSPQQATGPGPGNTLSPPPLAVPGGGNAT